MSNEKGQLIVISAPSGAGKTSVIRNVIKKLNDENIKSTFSVSHTTRLPRDGDIAVSYTHLTLPTNSGV